MTENLRIAAVVTTFFPNSHAGVLVSKFLTGFATDEGLIAPRTGIVSMYMHQLHADDIGLQLARSYDIPVFGSIRAAMTLGGEELGVDAVLIIGEHGDYPLTALGQEMLPRRWFFEQVCGVIGEFDRPVPVFTDKHLSYRWQDAQWMYETARQRRWRGPRPSAGPPVVAHGLFEEGSTDPLFEQDPLLAPIAASVTGHGRHRRSRQFRGQPDVFSLRPQSGEKSSATRRVHSPRDVSVN
jgi:hypothetical protein